MTLKNKGNFHALGRNVVMKYASETSRLFQMAYFVVAARRYGAAGLGNLTVLLMIGSGAALLLGDLGINTVLIVRMSGSRDKRSDEIASDAIFWKVTLSVVVLILMLGGMYISHMSDSWREIFSVAAISVGSLWLELLAAFTNAVNRFDSEIWLRVCYRGFVYGGGAFAALYLTLRTDLMCMGMTTLGVVFVAFLAVRRVILPVKIVARLGSFELITESVHVWVTQLAQLTYLKFDVVILGLLHVAANETGWYAAAWKIADVLTTVPALLSAAALPIISGALGKAGVTEIARGYLKAMYVIPFLFALPLAVGAPWFTHLLYGDAFIGTPRILRILTWAIVPFFVHTFLAVAAVSVGRQREAAKLAAATSFIGMLAAVLLVPRLGYEAMAVICLVANSLFALSMIYRFRDLTQSAHLSILIRSLTCAMLVYVGCQILVNTAPAPMLVISSLLAYCFGLALCGVLKFQHVKMSREFITAALWNRESSPILSKA